MQTKPNFLWGKREDFHERKSNGSFKIVYRPELMFVRLFTFWIHAEFTSKHEILKAYYFCESTETGAVTQRFEQQISTIVIYTGDLFTGMDFDTVIHLSVSDGVERCHDLWLLLVVNSPAFLSWVPGSGDWATTPYVYDLK